MSAQQTDPGPLEVRQGLQAIYNGTLRDPGELIGLLDQELRLSGRMLVELSRGLPAEHARLVNKQVDGINRATGRNVRGMIRLKTKPRVRLVQCGRPSLWQRIRGLWS